MNEREREFDPNGAAGEETGSEARLVANESDESTQPERSSWLVPLGLFLLTVFTTLWAGAYQDNPDRLHPLFGAWERLRNDPAFLMEGIPFAATLLLILVTHELGHYVLSLIHRVPASLPLFIPGLPVFIGTFGAIIRLRGSIQNRKALFDIGVAGPIAGFLVAVIALMVGLHLSSPLRPGETDSSPYVLGPSLLVDFFVWIKFGPLPPGYGVILNPIANAAWFGLFVTSLNLIPIGQLDGGHVAYALWGARQRTMAFAIVPILIILGFVGWPGWFLWAGMAGVFGLSHPPVLDPEIALGQTRVWIGWAALAIFILTFAPVPFSVH